MIANLLFWLFLTQANPPLTFDTTRHDFGAVKTGTILRKTIQLKNDSADSVEITNIVTVCGCQQPKIGQKKLPAGQSTTLEFSLNTITQNSGPNQWKATVQYSQSGNSYEKEILFTAQLTRELEITPVQIAGNFESTFETKIVLHDRRAQPKAVRAVRTSLTFLETHIGLIDASGTQTIELKTKANMPVGEYSDILLLDTQDPDYPELKIPIRLVKNAANSIAVQPEKLTLRWVQGQKAVVGRLLLRAREEGKKFEIDKIECELPNLQTKFALAEGYASVKVTLETENLKTGETELQIQIKDPLPRTIKVPVRWEAP
ncbi:DUF1573 domain-containing protein [Telmatocola sphagniphila]|uniref:DUF1573 domain-containing protein n=1 Tax=Telmatocola sphagniphila TaxID=1123043 RepID=A0A8E6EWU2_9BACT|nr:DUF1573 domain-containing protein [Telmatocola sphagniphila]QVL30536.1 DUF1573 domain-containing protein [Telmatocola sphagniphila]